MKIFYVHHAGRKVKGRPSQEDGIISLGKKDAKNMAKSFAILSKKFNFKAIYTSQFLRCKLTAKIINKKLNLPIYIDPRLDEFKSIQNETWTDCQKRIMALLKEIVDKHDEKDAVLCITSGVNLTAFVAAAYSLQPGEKLPFPIVATCSPIGFDITKNSFKLTKQSKQKPKSSSDLGFFRIYKCQRFYQKILCGFGVDKGWAVWYNGYMDMEGR